MPNLNEIPDYAKMAYYDRAHHARYKRFIEAMEIKLLCQECKGAGGWIEPVLDDGTGPSFRCGWCEGTGYVTPWVRGLWLRYMKQLCQA